jgi:hypothetical protein
MFVSGGKTYRDRAECIQEKAAVAEAARGGGVCSLSEVVPSAASRIGDERPGLLGRLVKRLGWGDDPGRRRVLYDRLVSLHECHPREIEDILSVAWADSAHATKSRERLCIKIILKLVAQARLQIGGRREEVDIF